MQNTPINGTSDSVDGKGVSFVMKTIDPAIRVNPKTCKGAIARSGMFDTRDRNSNASTPIINSNNRAGRWKNVADGLVA